MVLEDIRLFRRSREGYPEGDYTLYHKLEATKFVQAENFLDLLATTNEVRRNEFESNDG